MAINRAKFFDGIRNGPFPGRMTAGQVDGVTRILDEWERRKLTDLRWLACILGESFWESARTMQPVRERGGEAYLRSKKYYPWVGEGLIQVTWEENHKKFGATAPGQLMTWPIALRALFDGMIKGMFTGKKLADYFNATTTDWFNSRRIVNGTDKAAEIAAICKQFHEDLKAADQPTVVDIAKKAGRDAGIAGGATGVGKAGETAVVDTSLPWGEILIAAIVVAVLVFVVSFGWRWWKARKAANDSAAPADAGTEFPVPDTPSAPKRLSGAEAAIADDLAASIASAAKARVAVAKSAVPTPRRKPRKAAGIQRRAAKRAAKKRRA